MTESNTTITASFMQLFKKHLPKLFKFGLIGGSAAIIDFGVFAFLLHFFAASASIGIGSELSPITIANTAGILTGFVWSFFLQKHWAFKAKGNAWLQFIATAVLLVLNIVITSSAIPVLSSDVGISLEASKIVTQLIVVAWNYAIYNCLIFRQLEPG